VVAQPSPTTLPNADHTCLHHHWQGHNIYYYLYKVNIDVSTKESREAAKLAISQSSIECEKDELEPSWELSEYFQESGPSEKSVPKKAIHILVQVPRGESIDPRAWS